MGDLTPVAFDIETSGLDPSAVITVAGLAFDLGVWVALNTGGRDADADRLESTLERRVETTVHVAACTTEADLLSALRTCADARLDTDRHYLTAFNGETWTNGFDLPFLRRACIRRDHDWPFPDLAYVDVMTVIDRIDTGDDSDLTSVYDQLIGGDRSDPFTDSRTAVAAYDRGEWIELLVHNIADIRRTRELAVLAEDYVPQSDFRMKNLAPPNGG